MMPNGWISSTIKELSESVKVGFVGSCQKDYREFGIPLIRTTNLQNGKITLDNLIFVTEEFHKNNKKSQLQELDLLIARHGEHGSASIVPLGFSQANCLNIVIVRPDQSKVDPFYMLDLFNFSLKDELSNKAAGSTQSVVNTKEIASQIAAIPPLPEQRKIAKILSTWDNAIAITERLIATSQQQKKALMQQLLTGKKRLVNPDTGMVFDRNWIKQPLKKVVSITYGKSPKEIFDDNGQYDVIGTGGVTGRTNNTLCSETSVVIGRKGTINKPQLVSSPFWAIDTTFYCLPINNTINIKWFYYLTTTLNLRSYNEASGVPSLSRDTLYAIRVVVPCLKEQQKIASVFTTADKEIELLEAKLAHLKDEKKALMQQLLTGKRRVKINE